MATESLGYWDGLAAALEDDGVDGFVDYIDRHQETGPALARLDPALHARTDGTPPPPRCDRRGAAPGTALRPFGSIEDLSRLDLPALVVASGDEADPGHPYAAAAAYAEALPRARLLREAEGQSPLAWQGGRLSREIETFYKELQ